MPARQDMWYNTGMTQRAKEYVIARTARKKPTVQHKISGTSAHYTVCGLDIRKWPWRYYQVEQMGAMVCHRCVKADW